MKNKTVAIKSGRYLVHNDGIELDVIGGPYETQKTFEDAIVGFIPKMREEDVLHIMSVTGKGVSFSEFSNGFMDEMQERA